MEGIPTEFPLVLRESLGSSHNRLTSAEDYEEALLSGYLPVGLWTRRIYTMPKRKAIAYPDLPRPARPEGRDLRSPWGQTGKKDHLICLIQSLRP